MNKSLLVKWMVRYKDPCVHGLWKLVLETIYMKKNGAVASPFWKGILQYSDIAQVDISWIANKDTDVYFWIDR
jgi:hypothetical protein